jgi:succinate dehydrogenase/fumarate reductase flavoprotein subunit
MEVIKTDVAIVGAGGAGLRSAIAVAESNPALKIALISKVYPMRSHTVAAEGGAAAVPLPRPRATPVFQAGHLLCGVRHKIVDHVLIT